jgi:hypothetical protein
VNKEYRIKLEVKTDDTVRQRYDLVSAKDEHEARAKLSKKLEETVELSEQFEAQLSKQNGTPLAKRNLRFAILSIDEIDPATISSKLEGPHLSTIPALQRLPRELLVIRPAGSPGCEWGWSRQVWRDAEGHHLFNKLKVVGCSGYMENPPRGGPYHLVETIDRSLGILLCRKHLKEVFPQWKKVFRGATRTDYCD